MKRFLSSIVFLLALSGSVARAQETTTPTPKETPPPPAAPRPVTPPRPVTTVLANGLKVICVPSPGSGLITAKLVVSTAGAFWDIDRNPGTVNMVADLLTKGTRTRTATQIAESIERLGASLDAAAGYDGSGVTLTVLKTRVEQALPILADVVQNPTFPQAELQRTRKQTEDDLSVSLRQPGTLARYAAARVLYGRFPYGNPIVGTPESLQSIQRTDLIALYTSHYRPESSVLLFAGDITPKESFELAKKEFANWRVKGNLHPVDVLPVTSLKGRIVVIDRPDAGQAAVVVNRIGIKRSDPDFVLATVTNDILGGGYSSRLNHEVRIKRGLSYGAGSRLDARRFVGPLTAAAQTKNESAGETARVIMDELGKLGTEDVSSAELAARKSALTGDFARSLETTSGLAGLVGLLAEYDRPLSDLNIYLPKIQATTANQVKSFAARRFSTAGANVVIVGNAAKFLPDLKSRFPGETITVIPFANLDLNSAKLTRGSK